MSNSVIPILHLFPIRGSLGEQRHLIVIELPCDQMAKAFRACATALQAPGIDPTFHAIGHFSGHLRLPRAVRPEFLDELWPALTGQFSAITIVAHRSHAALERLLPAAESSPT